MANEKPLDTNEAFFQVDIFTLSLAGDSMGQENWK